MSTFERLAIIVEANAGKAIAEFKQVGVAAKKLEGTTAGAGKSVGLLGRMSGTTGALMKVGMVAALGGAAVAIAKFAGNSVDAFQSLAGQVKQFQRITLTTAEDASRLVSTFRALNIDVDTAGTFFGRFAKNLGTGSEALAKVGITAVRTKSGTIDMAQSFLKVVDAFNASKDAGQRAAIGNAAFGRGWIALAPLLARGRVSIEELYAEAAKHGLILSEDDLHRAAELKIAMRDLKGAVEGLEVAAGKTLVPFLTTVVGLLNDFLSGVEAVKAPPTPKEDSSVWGKLARAVHGAGVDFLETYLHGGKAAEGNHAVADSASEAEISEQQLSDTVKTASESLVKMVDADRALADAHRSLSGAHRGLTDATADYNKLLKEGAVDEEKVADARRSLADATRSLHHAQREQTKAQTEYNKALANYQLTATDTNAETLSDASDNLADANDSVASATADAAKAAGELKAAQAGDPEFQTKLAAAKEHVADATQAVADAEYNVGQKALASVTAHNAETLALTGKADAAKRLLDMYAALIAQNPEIAAVLAPQYPALVGAALTPDFGNVLGGTSIPAPPPPGSGPTASINSGATTNNVTVNVNSDGQIDPTQLSRTMIWALN